MNLDVRPRPETRTTPQPGEKLRRLAMSGDQTSEPSASSQDARHAVHRCLNDLREALHRRGRLSSRNEALDEVARLIFAHTATVASGGSGIAWSPDLRAETAAADLTSFVQRAVSDHLPVSLNHELGPDDFALRLKPQEDALAADIVDAFERLAEVKSTTTIGGPDGIDVLNEAFGQFLAASFVDEKELGQYLTPPEVVTFMVRLALHSMDRDDVAGLLSPSTSSALGYVLDPSCGAGSFLCEFVREAHRLHRVPADRYEEWLQAMCSEVLVGVDKSERMIRLALANLAIFGSPAANLHLQNALELHSPVLGALDGRVGVLLTNPPFGATFDREHVAGFRLVDEWADRPPTTVDSELLFMERYLDWLKPGGQLVAVVPDSVLTNKGLFEDLRRGLAPGVDVLSVVSLPAVTFASAGTSTKTSVVHVRKRSRSAGTRGVTRFAVCTDVGYTVATRSAQRRKVHGSGGQLSAILEELIGARPERLVQQVEEVTACHRWDATFHASLPPELRRRLESRHPDDVRVADVAVLVNDRADPRGSGADYFQYIEISGVDASTSSVKSKLVRCEHAPSRARVQVRAGDVLVSTVRPERRAVGVVPPWLDGAVCTTGFAVLRPTKIGGAALARLLQADVSTWQLLRNNVGIAYPAIDPSCLPHVLLPVRASALQSTNAAADEVLRVEAELRLLRQELDAQIREDVQAWLDDPSRLIANGGDVVEADR